MPVLNACKTCGRPCPGSYCAECAPTARAQQEARWRPERNNPALRAFILARDGGICHLCGRPGATEVDHLLAHSRGGRATADNLKAAHRGCNASKGNRRR